MTFKKQRLNGNLGFDKGGNFLAHIYSALIAKNFKRSMVYRSGVISSVISAVVVLVAQAEVWKALYAGEVHRGTTFLDTVSYVVLQALFMRVFCIDSGRAISSDYHHGRMGQRLSMPVNYQKFTFMSIFGIALGSLLFYVLPMCIVCGYIYGFHVPSNWWVLAPFMLSMVLGGIVYCLISLLIGYTSFWSRNNWYLLVFSRVLYMVFGGTIIPLWFFPQGFIEFSRWLPFYYATYAPMTVYLEQSTGETLGALLGMQALWIVLLLGLERFVWHRAEKKFEVFGG